MYITCDGIELIKKAVELKTSIYLGEIDELNKDQWNEVFNQIIDVPSTFWKELGKNGYSLVDGEGIKRLYQELVI